MSDTVSNVCAFCQTPARQVCSGCKLVKYCSQEHQRQHWKQHKGDCKTFRIASDPELGRFLLATKPLPVGSVIFTESPLVVGPKWYLSAFDENSGVMPCVGCFAPCRIGVGGEECPSCHWPACSPTCTGLQDESLHSLECSVLMLGSPGLINRSDLRALVDYYRPDALLVLKCLLLQRRDPKKWTQLMNMQSHEEDRLGSELQTDAEKRIVQYLKKNFLQRLKVIERKSKDKFLENYDATVLHRICGIIETNYMCINLLSGLELSGVFYTGCMMEHHCQPNCYFQFDPKNGFRISVTAGRDIQKGEHLKIMYSNMLWGTQLRQEHLGITKHFQCKCERCCDPTELGTYFSALRCVGDVGKHCSGVQLPKDPLDPKTDWACNECPVVVSGEEVRYLLTQMTNEVEDLLASKPKIKQIESLLEKLSRFLHPNHYHMFTLKHSLIQLYGNEVGHRYSELSDRQLNTKVHMCDELLDICQRLDPHTIRLSIYVGIIYFEMQAVEVERSKRLLAATSDETTALPGYKQGLDYLTKAAKLLEKELDNIAGNKLNDAITTAATNLQTLIQTIQK